MTNSALSPILSAFIRHSRNAAFENGTRQVPGHVRTALEPFFDEETLDEVRWTVTSDRWSLDTLIVTVAPRYKAMTFEDTIVFQHEAAAGELDLWIHELLHVEQVKRAGGTSRFSRAYLGSWAEIETATVRQTNRILARMKLPARQKSPSLGKACQDH